MSEIWKPVPGYGGHYEASSAGRIRVKDRTVDKRHKSGKVMRQFYPGRLLSPTRATPLGHVNVHIGVDRKRINVGVHRLVLLAFVGPCPDGMEACHNNGDASDNRPENLRWDTHLENNRDRKRHGRYATGEAHHNFKFPQGLVTAIRAGIVPLSRAMGTYGVSRTHYYRLKRGP